jgi:predicted RNA-binding protein (virulence factor B family)
MSRPPTSPQLAFPDLLGRFVSLEIRRLGSPGAFLAKPGAAPEADTILLLGPEIPPDAREGDQVRVFVALDSEGRPLATTAVPRLALGEVTFLTVTACTEFGAFVDWGLPKELLVPFAEQTQDVRVGDRHPIGLYVDNTGRLAGTMRVNQLLGVDGKFQRGEWVEGEAWRNEPEIGLFVLVERRFLGLVPRHEPHALPRGEAARFRVTHVHPDGKIELSTRGPAHEELERDAAVILDVLARPGVQPVGDKSSPEEIRARFGLSKKAFKRAVGTLLKAGRVDVDGTGRVRILPGRGR